MAQEALLSSQSSSGIQGPRIVRDLNSKSRSDSLFLFHLTLPQPPLCGTTLMPTFPATISLCCAIIMWQLPGGVVVAVTGTVGNVLTLMALVVQPKPRTCFILLIANLTVVDLLYCTLLQLFSVDTYLHLH